MRPTQKAAIALIAGAIIHAAAGIVGQFAQASTLVSDDMFCYPWTSAELVAVSLVEALAFALGLVGLAALRASGVAGPTRAARTGLAVALAGSALFVVAELASIAVRDQPLDEGAAGAVGGVFGLATLLLGAGLTAAGVAARRARLWEGWRPTALLACGLWTLAMLGIVAHAADAARRRRHGAAAGRDRHRAPDPTDPRRRRGPASGRHPLDRAALTAIPRGGLPGPPRARRLGIGDQPSAGRARARPPRRRPRCALVQPTLGALECRAAGYSGTCA